MPDSRNHVDRTGRFCAGAASLRPDAETTGTIIYTVISVSGEEHVEFLQGQLTQDIERVAAGASLLAAWCTPKGRVVVTMRLLPLDDAIGLVVPEQSVDEVQKRLQLYRFRSRVDWSVEDGFRVAAVRRGAGQTTGLTEYPLHGDVVEVVGAQSSWDAATIAPQQLLSDAAWREARLLAGRAEIDPRLAERFTPHMLNLDRIGAISFGKGCYTGQEIVARTQNLGKVKRRLNLYRVSGAVPQPGERLTDGDTNVGEIVDVAGEYCHAIAPLDKHAVVCQLAGRGQAQPLPLPYTLD